MNNISLFLSKHKWLYHILNFTWGLLLTIIGLLISLCCIILGKKPHTYNGMIQFRIGKDWGGFSIGIVQVVCEDYTDSLAYHELGHSYQNAIFGIFMPFLVSIPSVIRYWYRELKYYIKGLQPKTKYSDIWFEHQADEIGEIICENKRQRSSNK